MTAATLTGKGDLSWLPETMRSLEIAPKGVLHIGAHDGEELAIYAEVGFDPIILVEPIVRDLLKSRVAGVPTAYLLPLAVTTGPSVMREWIEGPNTHQGRLSDKMYMPGDRTDITRPIVQASTLARIQRNHAKPNVLVVDTSGTELDVLRSGDVRMYELVVVETDTTGVHASVHDDVCTYMYSQGYVPVERWTHGTHSYADVAYVRA